MLSLSLSSEMMPSDASGYDPQTTFLPIKPCWRNIKRVGEDHLGIEGGCSNGCVAEVVRLWGFVVLDVQSLTTSATVLWLSRLVCKPVPAPTFAVTTKPLNSLI